MNKMQTVWNDKRNHSAKKLRSFVWFLRQLRCRNCWSPQWVLSDHLDWSSTVEQKGTVWTHHQSDGLKYGGSRLLSFSFLSLSQALCFRGACKCTCTLSNTPLWVWYCNGMIASRTEWSLQHMSSPWCIQIRVPSVYLSMESRTSFICDSWVLSLWSTSGGTSVIWAQQRILLDLLLNQWESWLLGSSKGSPLWVIDPHEGKSSFRLSCNFCDRSWSRIHRTKSSLSQHSTVFGKWVCRVSLIPIEVVNGQCTGSYLHADLVGSSWRECEWRCHPSWVCLHWVSPWFPRIHSRNGNRYLHRASLRSQRNHFVEDTLSMNLCLGTGNGSLLTFAFTILWLIFTLIEFKQQKITLISREHFHNCEIVNNHSHSSNERQMNVFTMLEKLKMFRCFFLSKYFGRFWF